MKSNRLKMIAAAVMAVLTSVIFTGCSLLGNQKETAAPAQSSYGESTVSTVSGTEAEKLADPSDDTKAATGDFKLTAKDGTEVEPDGTVYTVTSAGEYTATGLLSDGQIAVKAPNDAEVTIILSDCSVSYASGAPIVAFSADKVTVTAAEGTYNTVADKRQGDPSETEESEENYDAAIYAACDLKVEGGGTLIVTAEYDNGIKSKDDVKIKDVTLKVTAKGNAVKGNDSVTVSSGELILISTEGDCVKTENSDVSTKGKQKGTVSLEGGNIDVYAARDGISAAYNVEISNDCKLNIFTASYADAGIADAGSSELYLIVPRSVYSSGTDYYAGFYNEDGATVWKKFEYETMVYSGRTPYYGLITSAPSGYSGIIIHTVTSGTAPDGENYTASNGGGNINASMNGYLITSLSDGVISGDWVQITTDGGSSKTSYSSKGIKAENEIIVSGGEIYIKSMDDGLHANSGEALENGEKSVGNITVNGGSVTVYSADDGFHADGSLSINGGYVNVAEAHEGLEANIININGGSVFVYGNDDGINARKGASTPLVNITGGYVDVTTSSGDTDAIDSNGNITISGGFVLVKGGSSSGMVAGSVDADGTVTVTGGTIIALGGICETPKSGSVCTYISNGTSFSAGDYVLTDESGNELFGFTLASQYSSCWIASESLSLNGKYTLKSGDNVVLSWTQSSDTTGTAGGSSPGGFGPGGRR